MNVYNIRYPVQTSKAATVVMHEIQLEAENVRTAIHKFRELLGSELRVFTMTERPLRNDCHE